jgi:hypothetical protein
MSKKRTENLPELDPRTVALLTGSMRFDFVGDELVAATTTADNLSAVYQAKNVHRELVDLVKNIRFSGGIKELKEIHAESSAKLKRLVDFAISINDAAFPAHLDFAMRYAATPERPRREAVFRAVEYLRAIGERTTTEKIKAETNELLGFEIDPRTLADDLEVMDLSGIEKRPRGRPRKTGIKKV